MMMTSLNCNANSGTTEKENMGARLAELSQTYAAAFERARSQRELLSDRLVQLRDRIRIGEECLASVTETLSKLEETHMKETEEVTNSSTCALPH